MRNKVFLGIAALIIVVVAAGGFIYWQWSQVQQLKEQAAQNAKLLEGNNKTVAKADEKPPDEPGSKWVQHGDHWDKVPIADVSDGSEQQTDADQQVLSVDAAYIRSLILDTLQKTEQELTESMRDQLNRVLDYVQQNGLTKAQLEQLKQSLERDVMYEAIFAAEKAENARIHERKVADYNLAKNGHDIAQKLAAINRETAAIKREKAELSKKLLEGGTRWTPEERKRFYELSEQRRQLFEQSVQLHEEYSRLEEEFNAKFNNGN